MSLVHDIIKINFVREGYLLSSQGTDMQGTDMQDYPYHLISDNEMCDAFLNDSGQSFFDYYYPCIAETLRKPYEKLREEIQYHLNLLKTSKEEYVLPDWVYSYMMKSVISVHSPKSDIHDMLVMMGIDNTDDEFKASAAIRCYDISSKWIQKYPKLTRDHRPPTMFGEPHIIKSLRLDLASVGG